MPLRIAKRGSRRLPRLRGAIVVDEVSGQIRVRKWPKKAKKKAPEVVAKWRQFFQAVQLVFKYLPDPERSAYIAMAEPGPWLPRDFWTAHQFRRGPQFFTSSHTVYPRSAMVEVSGALDAVSQDPGSLLVRHPGGWGPLWAGQEGYVLTSSGEDKVPSWKPSGGGGGSLLPFPKVSDLPDTSLLEPAEIIEAAAGGLIARLTLEPPNGTSRYARANKEAGFKAITAGFTPMSPRELFGGFGVCLWEKNSNRIIMARWEVPDAVSNQRIRAARRDGEQGTVTGDSSRNINYAGNLFLRLERLESGARMLFGNDPAALVPFFTWPSSVTSGPYNRAGIIIVKSGTATNAPVLSRITYLQIED